MRVSRSPLRQDRKPAIGFRTRLGDDPLRDLALEHQHHAVPPGRPGFRRQPADQQRRGDGVGQVGDDARLCAGGQQRAASRFRAHRLRSPAAAPDNARRSRPGPAGSAHPCSTAMTWPAPSASRARVSPPGPGPISTTVTPSSGPALRAIRPVRLRSRRKFWPSDFFAESPWRAMTSRSGGRAVERRLDHSGGFGGRRSLSAMPRGEPQCRDQAFGARLAGAGDVECRPMIGRCADEGQAERDVDALVECQRLDRDQRLVVIHADGRVVVRPRAAHERACRPERAGDVDALARSAVERRTR